MVDSGWWMIDYGLYVIGGKRMYSVRVDGDFAAAHFLTDFHGKCERLHGHNYRVRLWSKGAELGPGGMLADFGVLKAVLREVLGEIDHRNLNDFECFDGNPSAEALARYIYEKTQVLLAERLASEFFARGGKAPSAVDVYETPVNMARYKGPAPRKRME
jgi:6-pyruvoyltetrahydropterin/6-carboxytetrahydropterin synthase